MPEVKLATEYDPMSGAKCEYWLDADAGKFHTKLEHEWTDVARYCHECRQAENSINRVRNEGAFGFHAFSLPTSFFSVYPHLAHDENALRMFLEFDPMGRMFKCTNARLWIRQ
jgi:hypothetical protein